MRTQRTGQQLLESQAQPKDTYPTKWFVEAVNMLTNEQRKELRNRMETLGVTTLPRNLYFNYQTQEWID